MGDFLKLTFLGTSAGKPTKQRGVSALALEFDQDNKWYLFDCGEGTQRQIIQSKLHAGKLDAIFITHLHGDHYYGLPGLLSTRKLDMSLNPLSVYGPKGIRKFLECALDVSEVNLGYILNIMEYMPQDEFIFERFSLKVLPLVHSKESAAFYIKEKDARKIIIAGDNAKPYILGKYLQNLDLLVHECTFTQETYDNLPTKFMHTTAEELGITANEKHVRNLIANHMNPRYDNPAEIIYNEIRQNYNGELFIANDFDVYYLSKDKLLSKISPS